MRNRTIFAGVAVAAAAAFGVILPATASPMNLAQSTTTPDPNSPGATSDPALLGVPRDQRDAPPYQGVGVQNSGQSTFDSRGEALRRAISLDPNRAGATSDPSLLGIPRDQRDAPPYTGINEPSFSAPFTAQPGVNRQANQNIVTPVNPADSVTSPNTTAPSGSMDTQDNMNNQDPNRPGATSDPGVLGAPRDQRDAPPVDPNAPTSR